MAEISFGGLATGLPTEELVESLMAIERRPLERLEAEKKTENQRLQAYGQFNTKLDALRSAVGNLQLTSQARTTTTRLSSQEFISASSSGAAPASYDVAVAQLAQVQKNVSNGFSSATAAVLGTGTITVGGVNIAVDSSNNSLQGLMTSINAVSGTTGVTASLIDDGTGMNNYHLVLSGKDASTNFTVNGNLVGADNAPIAFSTTQVRAAQQAIAYVDGIKVTSNSNTITGAISGVTLNLNQVSEILVPASGEQPPVYQTTSLVVEADTEALKEKISTFVSAYNEIMNWISSGYEKKEAETDEKAADSDKKEEKSEENLSSILRGDSTINDVKRNLQSMLADAVGGGGTFQILSEIGISTQKDGSLLLNEGKLNVALKKNFDDVVKLMTGEGASEGVMKKFNNYLRKATSFTEGMYAEKRERYEAAMQRLDDQIAMKEPMIDKIEQRIRSQFNAMELLVSNLNSQSAYLTQQMDMLSNLSRRK